MNILISDSFDPSLPEQLKVFGSVSSDKSILPQAEIVLVRSKTKCTQEYIDSAPNLKLIIRGGVGVDNIDTGYAKSKGIVVRNTPKASSVAVAELAFALMLAVPNRLIEAHNTTMAGKWLKSELKRTELFGKTLCLVGMGNIATEVAVRAKAFGMTVKAYRKSGAPSGCADVKSSLKEALAGADYVSLHVPMTDETRGMVNNEFIGWMKNGAVLVNTARGKCVVEPDLVAALESGKLGAYATDVWLSDPPAADCPLFRAPNVIAAPHIGANSNENLLRIGTEVVEIIREFVKGGVK